MMNSTLSTALDGRIKILQPEKGYRFAIDSIFLSAFLPQQKKVHKILDMGCGVGTVGLCVQRHYPDAHIFLSDIQDDLLELAKQNIILNELNFDQFHFLQDFRTIPHRNEFDVILMNPPFFKKESHHLSPNEIKKTANHEIETELKDWIDYAFKFLKHRGTLILIHQTERLDDLLSFFHLKFGSVELCPLWSKNESLSNRILVRAQKQAKGPLRLYPGITVHNDNGSYTEKAQRILKHGEKIVFQGVSQSNRFNGADF